MELDKFSCSTELYVLAIYTHVLMRDSRSPVSPYIQVSALN